jgi:ribonuclease R
VPRSTLPDDLWWHDEREQTLTGRRTRLVFRLGQQVEVRLAEASPVTGGLVFHVMQGAPSRPARGGNKGGKGRKRSVSK